MVYPKYSVLLAVYYKEKAEFLIDSLNSMLNQSVKPSEFIIVKDGPLTPELDNILNDYYNTHPNIFKFINLKQNLGPGGALQKGIEACTHELILHMDSDDYSTPDRFEKEYQAMLKYNADVVGSNVIEFQDSIDTTVSQVVLPENHQDIIKFSKKRCPIRHSSLLYKKTAVIKAGNYRNIRFGEDWDISNRLITSGAIFYNIQEPLTYMRVNPDFYKRRGGFKNLKQICQFKHSQYKEGYFTFKEYIVSVAPSIIITLSPNFIRTLFYKKVLRK